MLDAIRSAVAWDDPVIEEAPYITAKDALFTLCDILGVEWGDFNDYNDCNSVFNRLEKFIENIE